MENVRCTFNIFSQLDEILTASLHPDPSKRPNLATLEEQLTSLQTHIAEHFPESLMGEIRELNINYTQEKSVKEIDALQRRLENILIRLSVNAKQLLGQFYHQEIDQLVSEQQEKITSTAIKSRQRVLSSDYLELKNEQQKPNPHAMFQPVSADKRLKMNEDGDMVSYRRN